MTGYADVRSWDPDAIEDSARLVRGRSADSARTALAGLRDHAEHLVAESAHVQKALQDAADAVTVLRRQIDELESFARSSLFVIGPDGSIHDSAPGVLMPAHVVIAQTLAMQVGQVVTAAWEIDSRLAKALESAVNGTIGDYGATTLAGADITSTVDGKHHTGPAEKPVIEFDEGLRGAWGR